MTSLSSSDSNDKNKVTDKFQHRFESSLPQIKSGMDYSVELILKNLTQQQFNLAQINQIKLNQRKTGLSLCQTDNERLIALETIKDNLVQRILKISHYLSLRSHESGLPYALRELYFLVNLFVFSIFKDFPIQKKSNTWKYVKNPSELQQYGVKSIAVFGSVARDEATPTSDIDLLVEFEGVATFDFRSLYGFEILSRGQFGATHRFSYQKYVKISDQRKRVTGGDICLVSSSYLLEIPISPDS